MMQRTRKHFENNKLRRQVIISVDLLLFFAVLILVILLVSSDFGKLRIDSKLASATFQAGTLQAVQKTMALTTVPSTAAQIISATPPFLSHTNARSTDAPPLEQIPIVEPTFLDAAVPVGRYLVQPEDTLASIAAHFNLTTNDLRNANFMYGDAILAGQLLIIPENLPVDRPPYRFASLDKDQRYFFYPNEFSGSRVTVHYANGTFPAVDPEAIANMMNTGLEQVERVFKAPLTGRVDVFAAGTMYEPPGQHLRGYSFSKEWTIFFLHDGSGDEAHQIYYAAHEITHLYAWNMFGPAVSFLLSEGAAVYVGSRTFPENGFIPIEVFCAVHLLENRLPRLSEVDIQENFRGHNNHLINYYASGCLVGYLIETYGLENFSKLYPTRDYLGVYGKDLPTLEDEWRSSLQFVKVPEIIDTDRFVAAVELFMQASQNFYPSFWGAGQYIEAYFELDQARLALLRGNFDLFDMHMAAYSQIISP